MFGFVVVFTLMLLGNRTINMTLWGFKMHDVITRFENEEGELCEAW